MNRSTKLIIGLVFFSGLLALIAATGYYVYTQNTTCNKVNCAAVDCPQHNQNSETPECCKNGPCKKADCPNRKTNLFRKDHKCSGKKCRHKDCPNRKKEESAGSVSIDY